MLKSASQIQEQQREQMDQLIVWLGTSKRLAATIGVTVQAVYAMRKRGRISKKGATIIHKATEGGFDRDVMRPDVVTWAEEV